MGVLTLSLRAYVLIFQVNEEMGGGGKIILYREAFCGKVWLYLLSTNMHVNFCRLIC